MFVMFNYLKQASPTLYFVACQSIAALYFVAYQSKKAAKNTTKPLHVCYVHLSQVSVADGGEYP